MAQLMLLLVSPAFWLGLALAAITLAALAWQMRLSWRPAWLLRVGLIGLIFAGIFYPGEPLEARAIAGTHVMIVDQSDSIAEDERSSAWGQALDWQAGGENRLVIAAGAGARTVMAQADAASGYALPQVDGRASDLEGALSLAEVLLEGGQGRITLATDGLALQPDRVTDKIVALSSMGIALDFLPLSARSPENDLALVRLSAPIYLWSGTSFDLFATVAGSLAQDGVQLELKINGEPSPIAAEELSAGTYRFHIPEIPEGVVVMEVGIQRSAPPDAIDTFEGNNTAFTTLHVFPPPNVLFMSNNPERVTVTRFLQALTSNGVQVRAVFPQELPTNLAEMQGYQVIFLENLLASELTQEQMRALQLFVSRLAGGLVVLGGRNSYTLGGYQESLIEPMLPVKLEPPARSERPPMVFQLILDRSSSMEIAVLAGDEVPPIALAREAAMRAIETLRAEDYLGVLTFSDSPNWDVPLRVIGDAGGLREAQDAVSRVRPNGGTQMYEAMIAALEGMAELPPEAAPKNRHILMLSDGQSSDGGTEEFRVLAETAHSQGITISTIALGKDADTELMRLIAEAGEGRFYAVEDAMDLPHILISESEAARSENIQTGETRLKIGESGHPILSGLRQSQLPVLNGYNALTSKAAEGAEDVLIDSSFDDPILATWQYGLGRVTAWMGDIGDEWMGSWSGGVESTETAGQFWSQVIRYGLVDPTSGPAQVNIQVEATRLRVQALVYTREGEPLNLTEVIFSYAGTAAVAGTSEPADPAASGQVNSYRLVQNGAGSYYLEIPRPADGAYRAVLEFTDETGQKFEIPAPFAVNPPQEWLPQDPAVGMANLNAWAKAAGGGLTQFDALMTPVEPPAEEKLPVMADLWQRLMLAVVVYWLLEIAARRRWLPWMGS